MSRNHRLWSLGTSLAILLILFIYFFGEIVFVTNLQQEVAKVLLQVTVIGFIGAYARHLFEQVESKRKEQENSSILQLQTLNIITDCYWNIRNGLEIIHTHQSAKSYNEQMKIIINTTNILRKVDNEISSGMYPFNDNFAISQKLMRLICEIEKLIKEWKENSFELSHLQKDDESLSDYKERKVPQKLKRLPVLSKIERCHYQVIHTLFEETVNPIRKQITQDLATLRNPDK